ncbi:tRNA pseudouridine(38-40) synthase TruA [Glutamicibacter sp. MNS18]|uniref:tRNA pseudouridine(38-40) synthase TruA n=1 Tax=Glutamicibacter sp. MNS18 TaxID=2989817 RepID=UPI00223551A2|nr:tRNA pseudouridine(38-40) synthase TruA [Glutamicibacter sp. MNS18]MCW4464187.1 tRNA pseudouridine(38-40) synthase TruA [Glutamicibacter sp. MNS18]
MSSSAETINPFGALVTEGSVEPASIRLRMRIGYDGSAFHGWARQPNVLGVQQLIEEGLAMLIRRPVRVTVAGRTDAGVHARAQVVHFDLTPTEYRQLPRRSELSPADALVRRLNGVLGPQEGAVLILDAQRAEDGFDARFSALQRRYSYRIADGLQRWDPLTRQLTMWHREELDVEAMNAEARSVLGRHDFLSYCKPRPDATTIRTLQEFSFTRGEDGIINAHLVADAFCHNMVRALIGAAVMVGDGREKPGFLAQRLVAMVRDSKTKLAHPRALVLEEVRYPGAAELAVRAAQTRAKRRIDEVVIPPLADEEWPTGH